MTRIRDATQSDLARITEILNQAISSTTSSFDLTATTVEQRDVWMRERRAKSFPVLVAERNGSVVGFGSFAMFRPWEGYRYTVEHSIYIDPRFQNLGAGTTLLLALIERARGLGIHVMVAAIEATNAESIDLHRKAGFEQSGYLSQVGCKFDKWLDLVLMQKSLECTEPGS